ncbi:atherin-like [Neopelma chrysocephalum]|uniref:atherin-like n=1 Tax=Neopelma chrysocephalum TaxID=114329 RepID=UPI000FCCE99C|nr:atherin-like [Neopelma chrysocephalum]
MAARGPLPSESRLSCCLTPASRPQRRLAALFPGARTGWRARRRRARAAGSWAAAGTGAGSPLSAPRRAPRARGPQADGGLIAPPACPVPLRSAPLPLPLPLPPPPCPGDAVGAAPPPSSPGSDPRRQIRLGLSRRSSPGTGKIIDLGPAMPYVLGYEQPKATGSSPANRRWGHLVLPVGWGDQE